MDCYACIHWDYYGENSETHEGYGYCRNLAVEHFGSQTDECDDGCNDGCTLNLDSSNYICLETNFNNLIREVFLVRVSYQDQPKWYVINSGEFLNKSGEFVEYEYSSDEAVLFRFLFDTKDEAIATYKRSKEAIIPL